MASQLAGDRPATAVLRGRGAYGPDGLAHSAGHRPGPCSVCAAERHARRAGRIVITARALSWRDGTGRPPRGVDEGPRIGQTVDPVSRSLRDFGPGIVVSTSHACLVVAYGWGSVVALRDEYR